MTKHPFLLTMPTYAGSLAAVRCLGRNGIPVTVASSQTLAAARWSRYASRTVRCPSIEDPERYLEWLLEFGDREPKHVLYPSSDDIAYLIASHAAEIGRRFFLYQPSIESLMRVQDKKLLHVACQNSGVDTTETWYPEDEADLRRMAAELTYPVLIKARTQVRRAQQTKGTVVHHAADLVPAYRDFVAKEKFFPGTESCLGDAVKPMIQRFFAKGAESVVSITGFIDKEGTCLAARASRKVFLRTRPVGLGLCFESQPLEPSLLHAATRLCCEVGHFGIFEIEFLRDAGRDMVIDFNPRFYGQMGFDHARGLPLAFLAWLGAVGHTTSLNATTDAAANDESSGAEIFTDRFAFDLLLRARRLNGAISAGEYARWRNWMVEHAGRSADAFEDRDDRWPGLIHAASQLILGIQSLRRVFRRRRRMDGEMMPSYESLPQSISPTHHHHPPEPIALP